MRTLLIAAGLAFAMTGSAFAMDGGCASNKAHTADAGKMSTPATSQTASAAQPQAPVATATPAEKPVENAATVATSRKPS